MGIRIRIGGIRIGRSSSPDWTQRWSKELLQDDLIFSSSTRSGTTLINDVGVSGQILPVTTYNFGRFAETNYNVSASTIWLVRGRFVVKDDTVVQGAAITGHNTRFYFGTDASEKWRFGWGSASGLSSTAGASDTNWHTFLMYDKRMWILDPLTDISESNLLNIISTVAPTINQSAATWSGTEDNIFYGKVDGTSVLYFEYALSYLGNIADNQITWSVKHIFYGRRTISCLINSANDILWSATGTKQYNSVYGSDALMVNGYSLYTNGTTYVYAVALDSGEFYGDIAGFTKVKDVTGSLTAYNKAAAYLTIPVMDRSDVLIFNDACRASAYYSVGTPTRWYVDELDRFNYFIDYLVEYGRAFTSKNTDNLQLMFYSVNKTGDDLQKVLQYIYGIYSISYPLSGSDDYIEWKISDNRVLNIDGAKILTYDSEKDIILYSENSGTKYYRYEFDDVDNISMAQFFENGNILFATRTKIYNSTDKLCSINQLTVKDTDGSDYVLHTPVSVLYPGLYFLNVQRFDSFMVDGDELFPFGNYTNSIFLNGVAPANLYCSKNGLDVVIAYKFGQNPYYKDDGSNNGGTTGNLLGDASNTYKCRHIHSITRDTDTGKWYLCTGDAERIDPFYENHWIEGERNNETGIWTWGNPLVSVGPESRMKSAGLVFKDGFIYFSSDSTNGAEEYGFYKTTVANIAIPENQIKISALTSPASSFIINGNKLAGRSTIEGNFIYSSNDLVSVHESTITNIPAGYRLVGRLDNGNGVFVKFSLMHEDHYSELYKYSKALMVKVK